MEYTYKNKWSSKASTATLSNTFLELMSAGNEAEVIAYESVKSIRLFRVSERHYQLFLYPASRKPIVISNRYCLSAKEIEDRSRQYVTFVRVLHLHLKNQGNAVYKTGFSMAAIVWRVSLMAGASGLLAALAFFLTPAILNAAVVATGSFLFFLALIFIVEKNRMPQSYKVSEIPLDFLP